MGLISQPDTYSLVFSLQPYQYHSHITNYTAHKNTSIYIVTTIFSLSFSFAFRIRIAFLAAACGGMRRLAAACGGAARV